MFVITALTIGAIFNPIVYKEGKYHYILVPDPADGFRKQYLGKSLEHWRFALGCDCDKGHCFCETLHNFTKREDRLCKFCSSTNGMWEAAGKEPMPECEKVFMAVLQQLGLDIQVACQADLPYWHGRIDFYHMPSRTAMQVDGSSHFSRTHHRTPHLQLHMDLRCCRSAWMHGGRLLRIHGDHGMMQVAAIEAIQFPYDRFVMLTRQYEHVSVTWKGISKTYVDWLQSMLLGAKRCIHAPSNCILFY